MANISVNTTELKQLLDITPADHNIMLVGKHGIGKSEILTECYAQKGMPVVALFLGQMSDPGNLIGIPNKNEDTGLDKTPDRRGWKRVSDILKQSTDMTGLLTKAVSAVVGPKAASAFMSSAASRKLISGREVLMNFPKVKEKLEGY